MGFDLDGPLPGPGVTVLEASAGTGKTFAVAGLVARFVAEGVAPLGEVLAVTFTRLATGELKDRVRARLVSAERGLARLVETGEPPPEDDPVLAVLATPRQGNNGEGAATEHRRRLAEALASFDSATITTTHGFCHTVLGALGIWGEVAPGAVFLEDPHDLVEEVVEDLYARWVRDKGLLPFDRKEALTVGRAAVGSLGTVLDPPADKSDDSPSGLRRRLADATRSEVERRLVDANMLTYDGTLERLASALADPARGEGARRRLGQRYRVVLVDEFQDTDLVQWEVVERAFASGGTRLVLVGDPKQAVYAFRGADVYAYLAASRAAPRSSRFTLDRNWRSDRRLVEACDALFYPLQLGHPEIAYRPAGASCVHACSRARGAPVGSPFRLRWLDRSCPPPGRGFGASKAVAKRQAVRLAADDLAADVVELLSSGAELLVETGATFTSGDYGTDRAPPPAAVWRPLGPGDIAVLVRTNEQASTIQLALVGAGVPAVVSGTQSVLSTPAARDWLALLDALQQPSSRSLAAGVALSAFFGRDAEELAGGDERVVEAVHERLHDWAGLLRRSGVAALFAEASASEALPRRLLGELQGERRLTDLGHIAELLHAEATRSQLGPAALRAWLARRLEEAKTEAGEEEQLCRRLDSDSAAVQVLTVHRAKGLEFPVVYCPYLWDAAPPDRHGSPVTFHELGGTELGGTELGGTELGGTELGGTELGGTALGRPFLRKLDVGEKGDPAYEEHFRSAQEESRGEELRQMYVALSRAKHQVVLWWVPATNAQRSALGRALLGKRDESGRIAEPWTSLPRDSDVALALGRLAARSNGLISVEKLDGGAPRRWRPSPTVLEPAALAEMPFQRDIDLSWGRASYSSITSVAHAPAGEPVGSEPEQPGTSDEPVTGPVAAPRTEDGGRGDVRLAATGDGAAGPPEGSMEERLRAVPSPWAPVPAGAAVGTFVHRVLQLVDFSVPDLAAALTATVAGEIGTYPGEPTDAPAVVNGLLAAITTPLGPLAEGTRLRDLGRADRLDELAFELPIAGGDTPFGAVRPAELGDIFSRHVPADGLLGTYAASLRERALDMALRGYLNGSLDLVFRLTGDGGRYFVVDYKTNWLAPPGESLSGWHYRTSALEREMRTSNYVLQALLYLVALHRYLRWRLPGYEPEAQLGGVLYLFVRGMTGPANPLVGDQPCGVFSWKPPAALVTDLSDLLAAGSGASGGL